MKAAMGNSLLMSIMVTFLSVVLLLLIGSIVYTKAYRIKNRIVDEIEKIEKFDETVVSKLDPVFREIGYIANPYSDNASGCSGYTPAGGSLENNSSAYKYCVFKVEAKKGYYYKVVAFAYLDFPLVNAIHIPVYGETKIFYTFETYE